MITPHHSYTKAGEQADKLGWQVLDGEKMYRLEYMYVSAWYRCGVIIVLSVWLEIVKPASLLAGKTDKVPLD